MKKFIPIDAGYIRGAEYADKTFDVINRETNVDAGWLVMKNADAFYTRKIFVKFDISGLADIQGKLLLRVNATQLFANVTTHLSIAEVSGEWDSKTLTWNNAPDASVFSEDSLANDIEGVDVTDLVRKSLAAGKKTLSFRIMPVEKQVAEIKIASPFTGGTIRIDALGNSSALYTRALSGDPEKDKEIWETAGKLFDEWYARYQAALKEEGPKVKKIVPKREQYTERVWASANPQTFGTQKKQYETRTYASLDDIDRKKKYEFDEFGGLKDESRKMKATGFFHAEMKNGRWWFVDPLGYPYVVRALSTVGYNYQGSVKQTENALRKFGTLDKWAEVTTNRLMDGLHFYATTGGVEELRKLPRRLVEQRSIGFMSPYGSSVGVNASRGGSTVFSENNTMPVFDPEFVTFSEKRAQNAEQFRDDPYTLGYTTDNELPMQTYMLYSYLSVDPSKSVNYYSYAAAWTWLCRMTGTETPKRSDITPELLELFRGFVWDRYFYVVSSALRRHDPNHMLLGCRFLTGVKNAKWVLKFVGKYLDCITVNWYFAWEPDENDLYDFAVNSGKPLMITEFYAKGGDSGLSNKTGAGWYVETQRDRGLFYQNFTLRLLEFKYAIGWHWFQYLDNDPANAYYPDGRIRDISSMDSNKGIFSTEHEEYTECTKYMNEINENVYRIIDAFDKE